MNTHLVGTKAKVAIQCNHPVTNEIGSFLFIGDSHRKKENAISNSFGDCYALHKWAVANGWICDHDGYIKA